MNGLRKLSNAFAHSTGSASRRDPAHCFRLVEVYAVARSNPFRDPLDPALQNSIPLPTILVAFPKATAQQFTPIQSSVGMGLSGRSTLNR